MSPSHSMPGIADAAPGITWFSVKSLLEYLGQVSVLRALSWGLLLAGMTDGLENACLNRQSLDSLGRWERDKMNDRGDGERGDPPGLRPERPSE